MLRVVFSDRVERLWEVLAARVGARRDPFDRLVLAVPSRVVERRAELAVARTLGIAAAIELTRLPGVLEQRVLEATGATHVLGTAIAEGLVRDVLLAPDRLAHPALAPVRRYLDVASAGTRALRERRACELAARLGRLYASYAHDRPELVRAWRGLERGPALATADEGAAAWQGALLREALAPLEGAIVTLAEGARSLETAAPGPPLVVLGYSYFSRVEHELLRAIAASGEVLVLTPTPCAEFWEDATRRAADVDATAESALLASWGTAAREHVAALDMATDYAAERVFAEGDERTRLGRLQASIRERRPPTVGASDDADRSIVLVAAPSLRREVEGVASEIWRRVHASVRAGGALRFPDVAVWIPTRDRELYLPQIETVFAEAHDIPWSGVDLALASRSRVVDALVRLVSLVAAGPTRAGLLDALLHPLVLARLEGDPEPEAIALAVERLGVFFGGSARELPPAYAADPRSVDVEQAVERLALGTVMLGEASGDGRFFEAGGQRWLPEELDVDGGTGALVALVRSLAADVAAAREAALPIETWARFFVSLAETYVVVEGSELAEHRRALEALRSLGGPSIEGGATLGCAAACDLALRALEALPAARGASDRGVLVGALAPHRASDHRLVFVLGLGEGRFPAHDTDSGLDLRSGDRRAGEVVAEDRERLALLEALVSAREAIVLSWVARDEQAGDEIARAHALEELVAQVPGVPIERPALRRDEALLSAVRSPVEAAWVGALALPMAVTEARARALGDAERTRWKDAPLPLVELGRDLSERDERRVLLGLEAIPPAAPREGGVVRVSIAELQAFLDCAAQASARRRIGRSDDDDEREHDAEPFDLGHHAESRLVRALVLQALAPGRADASGGVDVLAAVLAARGVAHGTFPLGPFGARARGIASARAERLLDALRRARPGASVAAPVRFGAGREHGDDAGRVYDPIALGALPDGRALELTGTTAPLLGGEEPLRIDFGGRRSGEAKRVTELRLALHACLDHAALTLAEGRPSPRDALVVSAHGATHVRLNAMRADVARRWLVGLAKELALEPQTTFMPIESILRVAHLFVTGSQTLERELARSIEVVRGPKYDGGRSRWGPLRTSTVVNLPRPESPARIAGQRFAPFFAALIDPSPAARPRARRSP